MKQAYKRKDYVEPADEEPLKVYCKTVNCRNCHLYEELIFEYGIPIHAHTCPDCGMNWWNDNPLT